MNHRENDTTQENDGKQVQQELEEQLRAFGDTMSDAFAHGFEGRGRDIGEHLFDRCLHLIYIYVSHDDNRLQVRTIPFFVVSPQLVRLEVLDFQLTVDDEGQCGSLHPSDAQHLASLCVLQRVDHRGLHNLNQITDGAAKKGFVERLVFALVFQVAESLTDGFFRE